MSVSICVSAQRKLSQKDLNDALLYNRLLEGGYNPPPELLQSLQNALGCSACDRWGHVPLTTAEVSGIGDLVEVNVRLEGDVMYSNGATVKIEDLPEGTVALRIYAS